MVRSTSKMGSSGIGTALWASFGKLWDIIKPGYKALKQHDRPHFSTQPKDCVSISNSKRKNRLGAKALGDRHTTPPIRGFRLSREASIFATLHEAHEATKRDLSHMRKIGSAAEPTKQPVKKKPINASEEKEMRCALEDAGDVTSRHFVRIALSEFCYKHRDVRPDYLRECIDLCNEDIALLPELQRLFAIEEIKGNENYRSLNGDKKTDERNKEVLEKGFCANIPTFKRLAIIHEKADDLEAAITVTKNAIDYYSSRKQDYEVEDFQKRLAKLEKKAERT